MKKLILTSMIVCSSLCWAAENTNIVNAVSKDEDAGWESVFTETNRIPFHINLYMYDGLYYELMEAGEINEGLYTSIFSEKRRITGRLGLKLHADAALFGDGGGLPDSDGGVAIRRFDVNTYGRAFFLSPLTYGLEFGVSDDQFFFKNGYVWFHEVPYVESIKFGFFKAPMSMESLQSGSGLMMMERAAPVDAFAPAYKFGTQLGGAMKNRRATLYGGWFADGADTASGDASESSTRLIARTTWLPRDASTEDSRLVHFGLSASHMFTSDEGVRYQARPESYLAPYLVDTGNLGGNSAAGYGLESALVEGPLTLQAEGLGVFADDQAGDDHHFFGAYVTASWFLTGESRPYNRELGIFSTIKPLRKFSFENKTWGALETVGRFSFTDLSDGTVQGGEMAIISAGFNWYLTHRHRIMIDGGMADVDQGVSNGNLLFLQSRLQIEF